MIYLDNAATTFPKPDKVYEEMDYINRNLAINAGRGSYRIARETQKIIESSKRKILKMVNCLEAGKVVYTPSTTIALNIILNGLELKKGDVVYVSPYEHNAIVRTLNHIRKEKGITIKELPIDKESLQIDIDKMKYHFSKERPVCVCCTHISNVTGYILPIKDIFNCAKKYEAITVLDAAQSLGLLQIDLSRIEADFVAFASHKTLYGPFGIAGFVDNSKIVLNEYIVGGTGSDSLNLEMPQKSPEKYESASMNIIAIAGLNVALDELNIESIYNHELELTSYLVKKLNDINSITMYNPKDLNAHISIVSFNVLNFRAEDIGMLLDEDYDIAVRTGYHCAPFIHKYLKDEKYSGTVRVGIGRYTTREDIDRLISSINEIIEE